MQHDSVNISPRLDLGLADHQDIDGCREAFEGAAQANHFPVPTVHLRFDDQEVHVAVLPRFAAGV